MRSLDRLDILAIMKKVLVMVQLNFEQDQLIIGTLLGDACVEKNGTNCRIKFDHSVAQEQYLLWKHNKLANVATKMRSSDVLDSRTGKIYSHVLFNTKSNEIFNRYRELFYRGGKKVVPKRVVDYLKSPIALATWYLDDGAKRTDCNALRIHTNSYSRDEQLILVEMLHANFGLKVKLHKVKNEEYVIYISSSEAKQFCRIIEPVVREIPCMKYKLLDRVTTEEKVAQAA